MALTTVVTNRFFTKLTDFLRSMQRDPRIGELTLAMLVPSRAFNDSWSLVIASKQLDRTELREANSLVSNMLRDRLGDDAKKVNGLTILRTSLSTVKMLGEEFDIPDVGTAYQASGMVPLALDLDDPVLFVSKAA